MSVSEKVSVALRCPSCAQTKPCQDFYRNKQTKTGYQSWCKSCDLARRKNAELDHSVYSLNRKFLRASDYVIALIETGDIKTRQQLWNYLHGRTADKLRWVDESGILSPSLTKKEVTEALLELSVGGLSVSTSKATSRLVRWTAFHYGSWLQAQRELFNVEEKKFWYASKEDLQDYLVSFVEQHSRLPLRQEFDGEHYPYWEAYFTRFGFTTWSETLGQLLKDVDCITTKHGTGYRFLQDGVLYLSAQELVIGNILEKNNIVFYKEIPYGDGSKYLFDFYLPEYNVYIEYYGLATAEYLSRIKQKQYLYGSRDVIEIYKNEHTETTLVSELRKRGITCE